MNRPQIEVADVIRQHGEAFLARYGHTLSGAQHRALRAIELCRTAALGGHLLQCDQCGHQEQAYNSCRNRHCPKCHGATQAAWLKDRQGEILQTPYVHGIFTLPQDLSPLVLQNPQELYPLLFRSVSQTLLDIAGDPKHLGAEMGGLAVLHKVGPPTQPGAGNSSIILTSTVSCQPVAWPLTAHTGCRVDPISSSPCGFSQGAFGAYSSTGLSNSMTATNSPWLVAAGHSPNSSPGNAC